MMVAWTMGTVMVIERCGGLQVSLGILKIYLFICFWLRRVLVEACGTFRCSGTFRCGGTFCCGGTFRCGAQASLLW